MTHWGVSMSMQDLQRVLHEVCVRCTHGVTSALDRAGSGLVVCYIGCLSQ
jgi:hypothetical protein